MSLARYTLQLRQDALTQALARAGGNVNACPAGTSLVDPPMSDLDGLANVYLRAGFNRVVDIVLGLARSKAGAFVTGHAAMAAVTVILLALLYVFWVLRSIRKMDRDIKRTRGTLLLFPTDVLAGVATFVQMVHNASAVINGMPSPSPWMIPLQPLVNGLLPNGTLTWQGAAGAGTYSVQISTSGVNGQWQTVCDMCVSDDGLPYRVPGGVPAGAWVRVQAFSPSGAGGPTSTPWQNS